MYPYQEQFYYHSRRSISLDMCNKTRIKLGRVCIRTSIYGYMHDDPRRCNLFFMGKVGSIETYEALKPSKPENLLILECRRTGESDERDEIEFQIFHFHTLTNQFQTD